MTQIAVQVPALSSTSRNLFVTSTDAHAMLLISVVELTSVGGTAVPRGQTGSVTINRDISNPNISNPNISNTEIYNPNISNPNISNPNISNPNISNPNISNPNISNAALTDATWTVTNNGNTANSYSVKMLTGQNVPQGVNLQLIISQSYNTPAAIGCTPAVEQHFVPVANIPNVVFYSPGTLTQPAATDPTVPALSLLPGESAFVTMRVLDTTTNNPALALQHFNPATATTPVVVSQAANTGTTPPPIALVIVPISLSQATVGRAYSQQFTATGGSGLSVVEHRLSAFRRSAVSERFANGDTNCFRYVQFHGERHRYPRQIEAQIVFTQVRPQSHFPRAFNF